MTNGRVSADELIALLNASLERGIEITIAPRGQSMMPLIRDGDELVCRRLKEGEPRVGDIVAFRRLGEGRVLFHRVVRVGFLGFETRGDAMAGPDGWITRDALIAVVSSVNGRKRITCALGRVGRRLGAALSRSGMLHLVVRVGRVARAIGFAPRPRASVRRATPWPVVTANLAQMTHAEKGSTAPSHRGTEG